MNTIKFPVSIVTEPPEDVIAERSYRHDWIPTDSVEVSADGVEIHRMVYRKEPDPVQPYGDISPLDMTLQAQSDAGIDLRSKPTSPITPNTLDAMGESMMAIQNIMTPESGF